jgi:hypothetical protein
MSILAGMNWKYKHEREYALYDHLVEEREVDNLLGEEYELWHHKNNSAKRKPRKRR